MSDVIPLAPRLRAQDRPSPAVEPGRAAAILFFTGVRYERQPETLPAAKRERAPRRVAKSASRGKSAGQPV
ncbi:hypothetical protein [Bosea sp. PAMC 26642]|uniref:hypothetical protein n=1 Tax=Bosea sp. (strain PAMC 26642) TaxID=1792307 RepID=UPI0007702EED|nr:hypothetical protein [Bosea sp. PAMC 26642]AMJ59056.1 hypothetical protein AXW83_00970 [Bosea sp. PAMC 26642]